VSRAWVALLAAALALGVLFGLARRIPQPTSPLPTRLAPRPEQMLALTVTPGRVAPAECAVPVGTRVRLALLGAGRDTVQFALMGYEDHVALALPPGATRTLEFDADRPGEDFAWLVNGAPAGRFRVTGSHLVKGHQ
jgi:FtsP/CotA-like multicopper oxidase with cupredoxin domain